MLTWCRSAGENFSFFLCLATCRTRSSACDTRSRPCVRCGRSPARVPLGPHPWLRRILRRRLPGFVRRLLLWRGQTSHGPRITGDRSLPPRCGPAQHVYARCWSTVRPPGSRTKSVRTCQVLRPRRAGRALALTCPSVLPSATRKASAPEMRSFSRLNSLACTLPCQRFADTLANAGA